MKSTSESKLLSRAELAVRWSVSIETLKRYERRGILRPVKLAPRCLRYREEDIRAHEESRLQDRREESEA